MLIIREKVMNYPVIGIADSWDAFEKAQMEKKIVEHKRRFPEYPWDEDWEKHYRKAIISHYFAEEPKNYWKD